jgi:hypothetical protein
MSTRTGSRLDLDYCHRVLDLAHAVVGEVHSKDGFNLLNASNVDQHCERILGFPLTPDQWRQFLSMLVAGEFDSRSKCLVFSFAHLIHHTLES